MAPHLRDVHELGSEAAEKGQDHGKPDVLVQRHAILVVADDVPVRKLVVSKVPACHGNRLAHSSRPTHLLHVCVYVCACE